MCVYTLHWFLCYEKTKEEEEEAHTLRYDLYKVKRVQWYFNYMNSLLQFWKICLIYWPAKERLQSIYCFIKLNEIFFLHIINIIYVVLEWICQIWTKFSEAKLRQVSLNGFARLARYLSLWVLWKQNSCCGRERMFWTSGKSTNFYNKPPTVNTSPGTKHTK